MRSRLLGERSRGAGAPSDLLRLADPQEACHPRRSGHLVALHEPAAQLYPHAWRAAAAANAHGLRRIVVEILPAAVVDMVVVAA